MHRYWHFGLNVFRTGGQRILVYAAGFAFVYALTVALPPGDFGIFSLLQSSLELTALVSTAGLGLFISNETIRHKGADIPTYARRILLFHIASSAGLLGYLAAFVIGLDVPLLLATLAALTASVIWILVVYTARGLGKTTLFVLEPALRSASISVLLIIAHLRGAPIDLAPLVGLMAATYLISSALIAMSFKKDSKTKHPSPSWKTLLTTTMSGSLGFLSQKADLLILAPLVAPAVLGDYKLAFVLAEVPYQIARTFLIHNQKTYLSLEILEQSKFAHYIQTVLIVFALSISIVFMSPICNVYFFAEYNFAPMAPFIGFYFTVKSTQFYYDYMLNYNMKYIHSGFANLASFSCKLLIIPVSFLLLADRWYICLPLLAIGEFVSWELAAYAALKGSPAMSLFNFISSRKTA